MSHRNARLQDQIRLELSRILQQEVRDPRVGLATVSEVRLSRDASHATVLISTLESDDEQREVSIEAIKRAGGFIRHHLAAALRVRAVPELHFELDRGAEHAQHINQLLDSLDLKNDPVD